MVTQLKYFGNLAKHFNTDLIKQNIKRWRKVINEQIKTRNLKYIKYKRQTDRPAGQAENEKIIRQTDRQTERKITKLTVR